MCKVSDSIKQSIKSRFTIKMNCLSDDNQAIVSFNKTDLSTKSAPFQYGLLRKCFSCSQIHKLNSSQYKTKRRSINRWSSSNDLNNELTAQILLKMIDVKAQDSCNIMFNYKDCVNSVNKDIGNITEPNILIDSYESFDLNSCGYETNSNNNSSFTGDFLSVDYSNRSKSVCEGSSPLSPSDCSTELSETGDGEQWELDSNRISCFTNDKCIEDSDSKCSSDMTLAEELTNYDKFNHHKSRTYRSNSSDSAIILPFNDCDFEDKILSLDSGCSKFDFVSQINHNKMEIRRKSPVYRNLWSHSIKSSSGSCPSLETPSVIISDHSTHHYEEKNDLKPCEENSNVLALAIESLLNSQSPSLLRRDSITSNCSSTSSLSSLGEDDFFIDNTEDNLCLPPNKPHTSAWRKVRSLVTSPFIQTYKKQKYPWVQLAGHQGNFLSGTIQGTILKKVCGAEEVCFKLIMKDIIKPLVPEYRRTVKINNENYLELEDLLANFDDPSIMDIKMGVRTYLEEELTKAREKPKLRKDMYEKMIAIDSKEPNDEENQMKAVTKPRYMIWRETISSTASLGFRIEGIKQSNGKTMKDFKRTKTEEHIRTAFENFINTNNHCISSYLNKLKMIRDILELSQFFKSHELIGSSLLFVHDNNKADIWLIDFAKTHPLPNGVNITHRDEWKVGNHEDGYLIGLESLIRILSKI